MIVLNNYCYGGRLPVCRIALKRCVSKMRFTPYTSVSSGFTFFIVFLIVENEALPDLLTSQSSCFRVRAFLEFYPSSLYVRVIFTSMLG